MTKTTVLAELKETLHDELCLPVEGHDGLPRLSGAPLKVYRGLKQIIINGVAAGHVFTMAGVKRQFNCIGRTARAAFDRLILEGYVQRLSSDTVAKSGYDVEYLVNVMRRRLAIEFEVLTSVIDLNSFNVP